MSRDVSGSGGSSFAIFNGVGTARQRGCRLDGRVPSESQHHVGPVEGWSSVMAFTRSSFNGSSVSSSARADDSVGVVLGAVRFIVRALRRVVCATMGHENVLHFESHRLSLRCIVCGYQTEGWLIGDAPPERRAATRASRARIAPRRAA